MVLVVFSPSYLSCLISRILGLKFKLCYSGELENLIIKFQIFEIPTEALFLVISLLSISSCLSRLFLSCLFFYPDIVPKISKVLRSANIEDCDLSKKKVI